MKKIFITSGHGFIRNHSTVTKTSTEEKAVCLFVCFVALRPKSTAMVMAGGSFHLATLFPGQA